jgi:hypothetical protein
MAEIHGSKTVLLHNAQDLSTYLMDDLEFGEGDRELHETTNYGDTADSHMVSPIKKGVPINIGGVWSPELHAIIEPLDGETDATEIRPEGTGSTLSKLTGNSILTGYRIKTSVNAPATWSATLTPTGGFTWGSQS